MNPRLRRLAADHRHVVAAFEQNPYIDIRQAEGNPPEKYTIQFNLLSLVPNEEDSCAQGNTHTAEVYLPIGYPRRPPFCRMTSPVWHPNIDPQKICIGDHWSAGQRLADLIVRIAEMLTFQSYNVQSPLNAKAAAWAELNAETLPLQQADLTAGY